MKGLHWSLLGPWPLRPGWMLFLLFAMQNFGLDLLNEGPELALPTDVPGGVVGIALQRSALSALLATFVVAAEYVVWRLTTINRTSQRPWAYALMILVGAASATLFRVVLQSLQGLEEPVPAPAATFVHYLLLLVILHMSIGVIGSRVSQSAAQAQEALAQLQEQEKRFVASEERARRLAAEFLHDRVQADLLVIAIELKRVAEDASDDLARRIASIVEVVEAVRHDDVRDTSRILSPLVQATGLTSALGALGERWDPAMRVTVSVEESVAPLIDAPASDADPALGIYRIVEQALLNAAAHGRARQAQVSVTAQSRDARPGVRIHVTDDGEGFDPAQTTTGGGFAIFQVWTRLLGGEWSVSSERGRGATLSAWIPGA